MNFTYISIVLICFHLTYFQDNSVVNGLFFPQYTVLQIVAAVSWPIVDPDRKAFMNVGFQFNYAMPFQPSSFYDPTYWRRDLSDDSVEVQKHNNTIRLNGTDDDVKNMTKRDTVDNKIDGTKYHSELNNHQDISAGELYRSLESLLVEAGYHETCLLKSVCEVARHPFHKDDEHEDLLAEILQFVLTPSTHQGFGNNEHYLKGRYEAAEDIGRMGGDCDMVYADCGTSIVDKLSFLS